MSDEDEVRVMPAQKPTANKLDMSALDDLLDDLNPTTGGRQQASPLWRRRRRRC